MRAFAEVAGARTQAGGRRREQAGRRRHDRADRAEDREAGRLPACRRSRSACSAFRTCRRRRRLDPLKDFTYIVNLTGYTFGLVVPASAPWKTLKEYVDDAKKNPGKIDYGSTGTGTTPHLAMEEFAQKAGIKLTHVPYKGSAELMAAILGGHLMSVSDSTGFAPQVEAGKLRLLATFGSKRTKRWPDVPDAERTRLRHDLRLAVRHRRPRRHGRRDGQGRCTTRSRRRSTTRRCSACSNATTSR